MPKEGIALNQFANLGSSDTKTPVAIRIILTIAACILMHWISAQSWQALRDSSYAVAERGKIRQSISLLEKAVKIVETGSDSKADLSNDLALAYLNAGRYEDALEAFGTAIAQNPGNGFIKSNISLVLIELAKYDSAEILLNQAIADLKNQYNNSEFLNTLNNLAIVHFKKGNYRQAERIYKTGIGPLIGISGGKSIDFGNWLNNLALLYLEIGRYEEAIDYFDKSLKVYTDLLGTSSFAAALVNNNLGKVYSILGDYEKAESLFKGARKIIRSKHPQQGIILLNLGTSNYNQGKWKQADRYYTDSKENLVSNYGNDHPIIASVLRSQALLKNSLGDWKSSRKLLEKALEMELLFFPDNHPRVIETKLSLSKTMIEMGLLNETDLLLDKLENQLSNSYGSNLLKRVRIHELKASVSASRKNYKESQKQLNKGLLILKSNKLDQTIKAVELHISLTDLALNQGDYSKAFTYSEKLLSIGKSTLSEKHPLWGSIYLQRARINELLSETNFASEFYIMGLNNLIIQIEEYFPFLVEEEKIRFFYQISDSFESFNTFVLTHNKKHPELVAHMFNFQMVIKAMVLNATTVWKSSIRNSGDINLIKQFAKWQLKNEQLAEWKHFDSASISARGLSVESLENEVYSMEKDLISKASRFSRLKSLRVDWKEIKSKIDESESVVEIVRFREHNFVTNDFSEKINYVALVVKSDSESPEIIELKNGNELEGKMIKQYRNSIRFKSLDEISYSSFWEDIAKNMGSIKTVYVSPDGVYNQLSLNSIYNPTEKGYLIDGWNIHLVTNVRDILNESVETQNRYALLVGNPDFDLRSNEDDEFQAITEIAPLPGTADEVDNLLTILEDNDWEVRILTENEASELNLREALKPGLLHIATHGFFNGNPQLKDKMVNPMMLSGLMLSGASYSYGSLGADIQAEKPDGLLTAAEAMTLNVDNTELVVLSACETGLGEIQNGDGVYGLQRSFITAGAKSLMMSLWKIDDRATQNLMEIFYENWMGGDDKYSAFRNAQLKLRETYAEPYYWGAFTLIEN